MISNECFRGVGEGILRGIAWGIGMVHSRRLRRCSAARDTTIIEIL
jgi:hypothetical protein